MLGCSLSELPARLSSVLLISFGLRAIPAQVVVDGLWTSSVRQIGTRPSRRSLGCLFLSLSLSLSLSISLSLYCCLCLDPITIFLDLVLSLCNPPGRWLPPAPHLSTRLPVRTVSSPSPLTISHLFATFHRASPSHRFCHRNPDTNSPPLPFSSPCFALLSPPTHFFTLPFDIPFPDPCPVCHLVASPSDPLAYAHAQAQAQYHLEIFSSCPIPVARSPSSPI
ncbi:hypothetical protein O181_026500 [Austropuccinia psidii MF-1]|uniref:Uncharacterized protein n=1 Tax=Austropuccinia psidii MF-1 TaxID=1389203 RepID=A0A9Q3CPI4_9BASI|nr:hypothetical protein [Austropuccinia psidii MF-1]